MALLLGASSLGATGATWQDTPLLKVKGNATNAYLSGKSPAQIRRAYGVDQLANTGAGQTVAIVDAYGSPTAQNDISTFVRQFGLPAANLTIAHPSGKSSRTDSSWAFETSNGSTRWRLRPTSCW